MDDFINELKEDLREEKIKSVWDQHGRKIVLGLLAAVSIIGLTLFGKNLQEKTHLAAATKFLQAQQALEDGHKDEALLQFQEIAQDGDATYRTLARLTLANLPEVPEVEKAKMYKKVYEDQKVTDSLKDFALLMGTIVQIRNTDTESVLIDDLKPLLKPEHPMMPLALELLTMICIKNQDFKAAQEELKKIIDMAETPANIRTRAQTILYQLNVQNETNVSDKKSV